MGKRALITGITGQDGAYLARLLLDKGYEVWGAYRRSSAASPARLAELGAADSVRMVPLELLEYSNVLRAVEKAQPDELYNLAAQSYVGLSFEQPIYTGDVDGLGVVRLLEAVRAACPGVRFYQASTSEMFGKVRETPQRETTPFHPRSPYGAAKAYAHWATVNYREAYGLHACCGLLFNHESPLRGLEFVTRKITATLARIRHGDPRVLELGNLEARRDWGFAGDYVRGMWLMLQQPLPDDYVLATGESHTVREFVELAAAAAGFRLEWQGSGLDERAVDAATGRELVRISPELHRPSEVDHLVGDASRAREVLGWRPQVGFAALVGMMVEADLKRAREGTLVL